MQLLPFAPSPDIALSVDVTLKTVSDGFLLEHLLVGPDVDALQLDSPASEPARRDELWKNTCFEAFFGVRDSTRYYEFNGSPSGDWAFYQFDDYRQGMTSPALVRSPILRVREQQPGKLRMMWHIPFFANEEVTATLSDISITAVLRRQQSGEVTYWALQHAGPKPDFHRRDSFIVAARCHSPCSILL